MVLTLLGIFTLSSDSMPQNASSPIVFIPLGSIIFLIVVRNCLVGSFILSANGESAQSAISVTLSSPIF